MPAIAFSKVVASDNKWTGGLLSSDRTGGLRSSRLCNNNLIASVMLTMGVGDS